MTMLQAHEPFYSKWKLSDIFLLFILANVIIIPLEFLFVVMNVPRGFIAIFFSALQPLSILLFTLLMISKKYEYNFFREKFITFEDNKYVLRIIFISIAIWGIATYANVLFQGLLKNLFNVVPKQQNVALFILDQVRGSTLIFYAAIIVFLVPLAEEVFFRGVLYPFFRKSMGIALGTFLASALFALAHFEAWVFFPTFLAGLGFTGLFERFKSLWAPVLAHMVWNGMGFALLLIKILSMS